MNTSDLEGVKTKVCSKCKIEKPVEGFSKDKSSKDGLCFHCKECIKEYHKANYYKFKERKKEYHKANYYKFKDLQKEYKKEYRKANSGKIKEYLKANSGKIKESQKEYGKDYREANHDKINAHAAKRRSKKLQATPPWLTKEHLSAIRMYYTESKALEKATGLKHHVDHIVPLQGKNVCGLHVPWNLQVLTASENSAKNNHYPDEWEDT